MSGSVSKGSGKDSASRSLQMMERPPCAEQGQFENSKNQSYATFYIKPACREPDLTEWAAMVRRAKRSRGSAAIALVGKYGVLRDACLYCGGIENGVSADIRWVNAEEVTAAELERKTDFKMRCRCGTGHRCRRFRTQALIQRLRAGGWNNSGPEPQLQGGRASRRGAGSRRYSSTGDLPP